MERVGREREEGRERKREGREEREEERITGQVREETEGKHSPVGRQ